VTETKPKTKDIGAWEAGMVQAARALREIKKDGNNTFHKYQYATAEAVLDACRTALAAGGMAVDASEWDIVSAGENTFMLHQTMRIVHESGECRRRKIVWPVVPERGRPLDKAVAVALTASLAYAVRGMLLAPRGIGEPDMSARDDREYQPPAANHKPKPKPKPKPAANPPANDGPSKMVFNGATHRESGGVEWVEINATDTISGENMTIYVRDPQMLGAAQSIEPGELYEADIEVSKTKNGQSVLVTERWRKLPHERVPA